MTPIIPTTQPEQVLENELLAQLIGQGYAQVAVTDEVTMLANLKAQLEALNGMTLTAGEFTKVLHHLSKSSGVFAKAKILRDRMKLTKEDGQTVYLEFFDSVNPLRNRYQVTQQVAIEGSYKNRYDVTILVNGLPLVQIELKRRGLEMKEAFNQIQRYQKHSYWSAQGLFQFVQLFVISNGVNTKYYANARRQSFKQTFYWAAEDNKTIRELTAFTMAFLNREHVGTMIGQYIVLNDTDIRDYNAMFGTNYSTKDTQSFYNYYQDIAKKVKERKVDILLVVNMFLTGFDCKTLNTLYVDKNLKYHGLVQAYSRTNRILNEVKSQGNIVVFRNLKKRTDEAIALFSNVKANEEIFVPPYEDYVKRFNEIVLDLIKLTPTVRSVKDLKDEEAELQFVKIFRELMRLRNILESFSEFSDEDLSLPAQRFADYRSAYLDLYDKVKSDTQKEKASTGP